MLYWFFVTFNLWSCVRTPRWARFVLLVLCWVFAQKEKKIVFTDGFHLPLQVGRKKREELESTCTLENVVFYFAYQTCLFYFILFFGSFERKSLRAHVLYMYDEKLMNFFFFGKKKLVSFIERRILVDIFMTNVMGSCL